MATYQQDEQHHQGCKIKETYMPIFYGFTALLGLGFFSDVSQSHSAASHSVRLIGVCMDDRPIVETST